MAPTITKITKVVIPVLEVSNSQSVDRNMVKDISFTSKKANFNSCFKPSIHSSICKSVEFSALILGQIALRLHHQKANQHFLQVQVQCIISVIFRCVSNGSS